MEGALFSDLRRRRIRDVADQRLGCLRVAAEHTHHRHNVSALLRSADAYGVLDVHLVGDRPMVPSLGPSRGVARWLRLHQHQDVQAAVDAIRGAGFSLWIADFSDDPIPPERVPIDRPVCAWFGAELVGVSDVARAAADGVITLPMRGMGQSLNLSACATAVLHVLASRMLAAHGEGALLPASERAALGDAWIAREEAATGS